MWAKIVSHSLIHLSNYVARFVFVDLMCDIVYVYCTRDTPRISLWLLGSPVAMLQIDIETMGTYPAYVTSYEKRDHLGVVFVCSM